MEQPTRGRIASLDGLRGVAALIVLVHHAALAIPNLADAYFGGTDTVASSWLAYSPLHIFWAGTEAVFVFFILSGLVLTLPVLRSGENVGYAWRAYYPARVVRLYIPVAASVVLALLFASLVPRNFTTQQSAWLLLHNEPVSLTTAATDSVLLLGSSFLNSPLWSLRWELIFSLLLPVYVVLAVRFRRASLALAGIAISVAVIGLHLRLGVLSYPPMFMLGVLLAVNLDAVRRTAQRLHARRLFPLLTTIAVVGITLQWSITPWTASPSMALPVTLISAGLLVFIAIGWPYAQTLLNTRLVQWLGTVSFSLYLTHEPLVVTVSALLPETLMWLSPLITIPGALALGWAFFFVVEKPTHRWARALGRRLSAGKSTVSTSVAKGHSSA